MLSHHPFTVDPARLAEFRDRLAALLAGQVVVLPPGVFPMVQWAKGDGPCQVEGALPVHAITPAGACTPPAPTATESV